MNTQRHTPDGRSYEDMGALELRAECARLRATEDELRKAMAEALDRLLAAHRERKAARS